MWGIKLDGLTGLLVQSYLFTSPNPAIDDNVNDDFDDIFPTIDDHVVIAIVDNVNDDFDDIFPKLLGVQGPTREWPKGLPSKSRGIPSRLTSTSSYRSYDF